MYSGKKIFLYVNFTPKDKSIGITTKIYGQINALRQMGLNVSYSAYENNGIAIYNNDDHKVFFKKFLFKSEKYIKLTRSFYLKTSIIDYLRKNKFDYYYIRLSPLDHLFYKILKQMKKQQAKIILDSIGYFPEIKPTRSLANLYMYCSVRYNNKNLKKYVNLIADESGFDELWEIPTVKIDNGVLVDNFRPHKYKGEKSEINLISVANETSYHGYGRLVKSISKYMEDGDTIVKLHLVGVMSNRLILMVNNLNLNKTVFFYGKKFGDELEDIYDKCNIAVGPLAQYIIGGKKNTGLKTKEYLAKGIPYIFSGQEAHIPKDFPYILEFPDSNELIDIYRVIEFYDNLKNDENKVEVMRAFARENFSWLTTMKKMLVALEMDQP